MHSVYYSMMLLEGTNYDSYFPCTPEGTNYDFYCPPGSIVGFIARYLEIFGSPSPRAKFVSYIHGYTCTSKDWFLLFIQNSLHCNKVVCMKHHFCLYSDCSHLFQQELYALLRLVPTCYHRNRNKFLPSTQAVPTFYHRNGNIICNP